MGLLNTALVMLLAFGLGTASAADLGLPAPSCELSGVGDKQPIRIGDYQGKVVYVDFWASWCGPCAQSFPFLNGLHQELTAKGLQIIGINVDEKVDDATSFLATHPASFTVAVDEAKRCPQEFGVKAMPSAYLIDKKGMIRHIHLGFRGGEAREELRNWVERLLAEEG